MNNDQWFNPGDKVMRVTDAETLNLDYEDKTPGLCPGTEYNQVLCVKHCYRLNANHNAVILVGISHHWLYARCFRKVDEIKLCVAAAEKFKELKKEEQTV